jgi:hypothetical protein
MAIALEKAGKGSLKEIVSVVRTFARFRVTTPPSSPMGPAPAPAATQAGT